jgi:hypothetical protein
MLYTYIYSVNPSNLIKNSKVLSSITLLKTVFAS